MHLSSLCVDQHGMRMAIWYWRQHQMPASRSDDQELSQSMHTSSLQLSTVLSFSKIYAIMMADAKTTAWTLSGSQNLGLGSTLWCAVAKGSHR